MRDDKPKYLVPQSQPAKRTAALAAFWRERWLSNRINDPAVLADVAGHTLSYPVTHNARVVTPALDDQEEIDL
jgi:hypothetical protein